MDTRRVLLALALSVVFFALYDQLVLRRYARPRPATVPGAPDEPAPESAEPAPPAAPASAYAAPEGEAPVVTVDTDTLRVGITEAGGRLVSVELKSYRRAVGSDGGLLDLVARNEILPATLDLGKGFTDAGVRYRADRPALTVGGANRGEVLFTGDAPGGARILKRFVFDGSGYLFRVAVSFEGSNVPSSAGLLLTPVPDPLKHEMAVAFQDRKLGEHAVSSLESKPLEVPRARWAGFSTQHFLAVAIPPAEGSAHLGVLGGTPAVLIQSPFDGSRGTTFELYAGPKDRGVLRTAGHDLGEAVNYGMFWFVALPLLEALRLLHRVTSNYGIDIIILTILVKLATIPLTRATFKNMKEMQRIQPQMAKIRERFKDDPQAMQREIMDLYKRHQVNPFAGCLPMLLQMPILMFFYSALMSAIELRQAPFALWIDDLASPDRLMVMGIGVPVLTLLMGASMVLQTWMTPAQGDPMQQRMMMFMPLIFTFMFINMPSGLVLYWLVNNVLSIAQQYWMMRPEPRPAG